MQTVNLLSLALPGPCAIIPLNVKTEVRVIGPAAPRHSSPPRRAMAASPAARSWPLPADATAGGDGPPVAAGAKLPGVPVGVVIGICSAVLTAVVTELYAHRCLAHHAFRVDPRFGTVLDTYFRVIVGTDPEAWATVHRIHHRYADSPQDPHSPVRRPPLAVLLGSPYLFAKVRPRATSARRPRRGILALRALVVAFFLATCGPVQVVVMLTVHLVAYLGLMGLVNTLGHLYGRKPHPDAAGYDLAWLAIPLLGHGYHNSHHAHPAAARTGPLDPIWPLLRALAAVGLVSTTDHRTGPAPGAAPACCPAAGSLVGSGNR